MHGREGENWKRIRHMWSVPTRGIKTTRAVTGDTVASSADSFCKGGRKISVGDCALFKPPQDSPPFIGIIRWLSSSHENNLQLGVNWLYRSADLKLGKGILLDAAPNEIFYSFHKDEIPAASLLHPCKVAFLPKGVELPPGKSSFVCRRVFDIANKGLWWLTDQDYIDERQKEIDQLLYKTQIEMHATVQPGGRSPKPVNVPTSTSNLKPYSDNLQNSATSFPSQVKRKKREHGDQGFEPVKRERSAKADDGDSAQFKAESILKSEIAKITEKGGLVDSEGVEKLVQLMQPDRVQRKMDLISRSMLAGVLAATDKFDCLNRFVQLRGLTVLDEWLQDIHKGKIGDGSSSKDGDKYVEEFLLVLLQALDKLPVNLRSLQMCNIGKSVNHLRTHKNLEIQKKARSLVDTWKKRVEAEMNIIDAKSGSSQDVSWPSKTEVSHGGNRHPGGSSEVATKSSVTQLSASKTSSPKPVQVETTTKSASSSPGPMKFAPSPGFGKDGQPRVSVGSASDHPSTTAREDKSSSSSQSHNYNQSLAAKEDAKSSTAGSMSVNKISSGTSRHRKSINSFPGTALSGVQRETGSCRTSSLQRTSASERLSVSGLSSEKAFDVPIMEGNNNKLIVKIPNRGRSPAESASGGSFEDRSIMNSRASSPVLSEKIDQFDRNSKEKVDTYQANVTSDVNTESWQSNDFKDVLTGSDEGDGSPAAIHDEERSRTGDDTRKSAEVSKAASSSSGYEKSGKLSEASFSSINALIESCVKYSEANASMSVGDDVGMNLLASVAAGEMSRSDLVSPTDSPQRNTPIVVETCTGNDTKSKSSPGDIFTGGQSQSDDGAEGDNEKQGVVGGTSVSRNGLDSSKHASDDFCGDRKTTSSSVEDTPAEEHNEHFNSFSEDLQPTADPCLETSKNSDVMEGAASVVVSHVNMAKEVMDGEVNKELHKEKELVMGMNLDGIPDTKQRGSCSFLTKDKVTEVLASIEDEKLAVEVSSSYQSLENEGQNKNVVNEGFDKDVHSEQKLPAAVMSSDEKVLHSSACGKDLIPENVDELKVTKDDKRDARSFVNQAERQRTDQQADDLQAIENKELVGLDSSVTDHKCECVEENVESKEIQEPHFVGAVSHEELPAFSSQETEQRVMSRAFKLTGVEAEGKEECASTTADASFSAAGAAVMDAKLKFDLNEGLIADDGKFGEPINLTAPVCSPSVHSVNSLPFPVSSVSSSLPASITVAAAAKGPFVPPKDLLRSKGELGWKGSAVTSAFRPAEPRKVLDMPLGMTNITLPDSIASRHGRPMLDIDLNVPDERVLEDMDSRERGPVTGSASNIINNRDLAWNELMGSAPGHSSGGLGLDLNRVDEANDMGQYSTSSSCKMESPLLPVKSTLLGGFPCDEVRRDFDLNNGPVLDDTSAELSSFNQHGRVSMQSQLPIGGIRVNSTEMGNFSSWLAPGNTYSAVAIPSILPDRGERPFQIIAPGGPQRTMRPLTGGTFFTPDVYGSSVLSSSPAVPFPSTPFQYPVFPFGTSFPVPSATFSGGSTAYMDSSSSGRLCFPALQSQLLGPAGLVSSHFPRPYMVGLPDGTNNGGVENNRKWGRQGLDLNAGPGGPDIDGRDETLPLAPRHLSVASSQALTEGQVRMFHVAGGVLKRKEPEGGWDTESFRYKQSAWQ